MKYLLDSDVIINHLRNREKLQEIFIKDGASISIITFGELLYGVNKSLNKERNLESLKSFLSEFHIEIINLNEEIIEVYINTKIILEEKGERLDEFDLLIAATSQFHGLILVTKNKKHFKRISKLKLL